MSSTQSELEARLAALERKHYTPPIKKREIPHIRLEDRRGQDPPPPPPDPRHSMTTPDHRGAELAAKRKAENSEKMQAMIHDGPRNRQMATDISELAKAGGIIVIAAADDHSNLIHKALPGLRRASVDVLTAGDQSDEIVERFQAGKTRILIADGRLIGDWVTDCNGLVAVYLASPTQAVQVTAKIARLLLPRPDRHVCLLGPVDVNLEGVLDGVRRLHRDQFNLRDMEHLRHVTRHP